MSPSEQLDVLITFAFGESSQSCAGGKWVGIERDLKDIGDDGAMLTLIALLLPL